MPLSAWLRLPAAQPAQRGWAASPERPVDRPRRDRLARTADAADWRVLELGLGPLDRLAREAVGERARLRGQRALARARPRAARRRRRHQRRSARAARRALRRRRSRRCEDEAFDLVVVDFLESPEADRVDAVRVGRTKVRPGGYLLLDDSDRPAYAEAFELLDGLAPAPLRRRQGRLAPGGRDGDLPRRPGAEIEEAPCGGLFRSEPVSRILSWAAIYLCGLPGPRRAGSTVLLGLAPGGVCRARRVTATPVRSYRTLSPLPVRGSRVAAPSAVCSLWHFPAGFPGWALPTARALWCPDFPRSITSR